MKNRSNVRKKDKEDRRTRKRRLLLGLGVTGLFGLGLVGAYFAYPYIAAGGKQFVVRMGPVREIIVEGAVRLSEDEVADLLRTGGETMFALDIDTAVATLEASPWIRTAEIRKEMPGRIRVRITEREPVALLERDGKLHYVDTEGQVIEPLKNRHAPFLPLLTGREAYPVPPSVKELVDVIDSRDVMGRCESLEIRVRDRRNLVMNIDGIDVKLGEGDFSRKLDRWFAIEPEIQRRKVEVDHVDLRYSNKVIVSPMSMGRKGEHG